jgi:RNA polymerase sigma-70 factor, ECF subfamily
MEHLSEEMGGQQGTEAELIRRARSGDTGAQQELWRAHRRWVAAIILAHRPRSVEVDDLMQDVALKLISRLTSLRDPAAFRPWLRQIVINVCRGAARNLKPTLHFAQSETPDDARPDRHLIAMPTSGGQPAEQIVDQNDAARRLLEQALTLPSEYREPLLLRCVRSMTYQQISELLNLPITTIETRLARARRMLREEIGDEIATEELA